MGSGQSSLYSPIINMSETQLKKLKAEKDRLDAEAEAVKELITVSAACQEYVSGFSPYSSDSVGHNLHSIKHGYIAAQECP